MFSAQELLEDGKTWNYQESVWTSSRAKGSKLEGDTVINGLSYKFIWRFDDDAAGDWVKERLIRKDGSKYYITDNLSDSFERLVFDFGLNEGDTFANVYSPGFANDLEVFSIDSITLENGEKRKQLNLICVGSPNPPNYFEEIWVEGLGSLMSGILNNPAFCGADFGRTLKCHWDNGERLYYDGIGFPNGNDCDYLYTKNEEIQKIDNYTLFPNPSEGEFILDFGEIVNGNIQVINHLGQIIYSKDFSLDSIQSDFSYLSNGIYIIQINNSENNIILSVKWIIAK